MTHCLRDRSQRVAITSHDSVPPLVSLTWGSVPPHLVRLCSRIHRDRSCTQGKRIRNAPFMGLPDAWKQRSFPALKRQPSPPRRPW